VTLFSVTSLSHVLLGGSQYAAVVSAVLVDLANADRVSENVGMLSVSPVLVAAAQAKADDMAAKGYFAHVSPEGLDSWHWFRQAGYAFTYAGENLAADFSDSVDVEKAWLASPTHRANLMNGSFTQIGIATAQGTYQGHPTTFVVQMFGTPAIPKVVAIPVTVQELNTTENPKEIALATTEPTPVRVLGASVEKPVPTETVSKPYPKAHTVVTKIANEEYVAAIGPIVEKQAPFWAFVVSAPKTTLRYAYYFLGLIILVALLARTGIEIKRHHYGHIAIAAALIALMLALFFIADRLIFTAPHVVNGGGSTLYL
jgi:hypothetical protein